MKRTIASLLPLGLVFSATAFAAAPPEEIPVFEEQDRFVIGVEAYFFRPSQTDMYYVYTEDSDGNEKLHYWNPDFEFSGGRVFASYMFTNENDIQIAYTYNDNDDSDSTYVAGLTFALADLFGGFDDGHLTGAESIKVSKDVEYQLVDLDMGHIFHDENYMVRVFAGLRYLSMEDDISLEVFGGGDYDKARSHSDTDGIGPRAGFDARFRLMDHVSITGHMGVALLKSEVDTHSHIPDLVDGDGTGFRVSADDDNRLIPNLDARLGVAVDFMFDNGWGMVIEGGLHTEHFFNAATLLLPGGSAVTRDVSAAGPYVGVAVMFS